MEASQFIGGFVKHTFDLRQPGSKPDPLNKILDSLTPAYPEGKVPINSNKVEAVRKLLKYIPEDDHRNKPFYEAYLTWPTTLADDND